VNATPLQKWLLAAGLLAAALAIVPSAGGQSLPDHVRIGTLTQPAILSIEDWMREGLSGLGYLEGRNLTTDRRRGDSEESLRPAALAW